MSNNWVFDIMNMQGHYGTRKWVRDNPDKLKDFLAFRLDFLEEELTETVKAFANNDPEELVDGLIDLCVVAIGTLDAFDINAYNAWDEVLKANMAKEVGKKSSRPNPLGVPDLVKPEDWKAPSHKGNHGKFNDI
jgi:predicted HAD superfamily Cof-like phosphohydrolase